MWETWTEAQPTLKIMGHTMYQALRQMELLQIGAVKRHRKAGITIKEPTM